jgi:hypothetical protein
MENRPNDEVGAILRRIRAHGSSNRGIQPSQNGVAAVISLL